MTATCDPQFDGSEGLSFLADICVLNCVLNHTRSDVTAGVASRCDSEFDVVAFNDDDAHC